VEIQIERSLFLATSRMEAMDVHGGFVLLSFARDDRVNLWDCFIVRRSTGSTRYYPVFLRSQLSLRPFLRRQSSTAGDNASSMPVKLWG